MTATLFGVGVAPAALAVAVAETGIELTPKIRPKKVGTFAVSDTTIKLAPLAPTHPVVPEVGAGGRLIGATGDVGVGCPGRGAIELRVSGCHRDRQIADGVLIGSNGAVGRRRGQRGPAVADALRSGQGGSIRGRLNHALRIKEIADVHRKRAEPYQGDYRRRDDDSDGASFVLPEPAENRFYDTSHCTSSDIVAVSTVPVGTKLIPITVSLTG